MRKFWPNYFFSQMTYCSRVLGGRCVLRFEGTSSFLGHVILVLIVLGSRSSIVHFHFFLVRSLCIVRMETLTGVLYWSFGITGINFRAACFSYETKSGFVFISHRSGRERRVGIPCWGRHDDGRSARAGGGNLHAVDSAERG